MTFDDPDMKQREMPDDNGYAEWLASLNDVESERYAREHPAPVQDPSGDGGGRARSALPRVMRRVRRPTLSLRPETSGSYQFGNALRRSLKAWNAARE